MNKLFSAIFCVSLALLTSCGGQPKPAPPAAPPTPPPPKEVKAEVLPSLKLANQQDHSFGRGTTASIWNLRGENVKELTVRLLLCMDGKASTLQKITCQWDERSKPMEAQLFFLVQDGEPFGVKGKRLPMLSLSFQTGEPKGKTEEATGPFVIPAKGYMQTSSTLNNVSGSLPQKEFLFTENSAYRNPEEPVALRLGPEEDLADLSKDGKLILAVIEEWK